MNYNEILSAVIQAILVVAIPVLVTETARYIRARIAALQQQHPEEFYKAVEIASIVVRAAEQLHKSGEIDDRLNYALEAGERLLQRYGITLDLHELRSLIEAEVANLPKSAE